MKYVIFQKIKNKIESVEINVKRIGLNEIEITNGIDKITLKSNYKIDSDMVFKGSAITVIAMYIFNGKLYPINVDDNRTLEEDDLLFLSSKIKGDVYSDPKISAQMQKQEKAIAELKRLIEEKDIIQKIDSIGENQKTIYLSK